MAATYCTTNNSRGKEVRAASATYTHLRGWDVGVQVTFTPDADGDAFTIWTTGGSHNSRTLERVGTVRLDEEGRPTFFFNVE